jgi:hypothetical protein
MLVVQHGLESTIDVDRSKQICGLCSWRLAKALEKRARQVYTLRFAQPCRRLAYHHHIYQQVIACKEHTCEPVRTIFVVPIVWSSASCNGRVS